MSVVFKVETEQEADGRWIAEVVELPGVLAYGASAAEAIAKVQAAGPPRETHRPTARRLVGVTRPEPASQLAGFMNR